MPDLELHKVRECGLRLLSHEVISLDDIAMMDSSAVTTGSQQQRAARCTGPLNQQMKWQNHSLERH